LLTIFIAVSALLFQPPGPYGQPVKIRRYAQDGWTLEIRRDRFSERTICRLSGRNLAYQPGALGFATRARLGVADAWYRIDNGAPRSWRDLYPKLYADGIQIETGGIEDPTRGIVWLPLAVVQGAREVRIETEARGRRRISRFRLRSFAVMYEASLRLGCSSDGFAV
jgi:hypothetical protein